ncbi:MAG: AraC family transcriptional regulator [Myxococcota bacterium]|nr:AraC family transcriptional regulator [Myxococcota bacterium]
MDAAIYQRFPMLGRSRAQVWWYSPEFRRPRHFHAEPELNLVVHGEATFGVGTATVHVGAGDLLGFPPGQDHVLLGGTPDLALFAIGMTPTFSRDILRDEHHVAGVPLHVRLPRATLADLVGRASAVAEQDGVDQAIAELWHAARRTRGAGAPSSSGGALHVLTRRTLASIVASPEMTRAELARTIGTCPTEIGRYFRRDVGLTLVQFRTRARLLRFIQLVDDQAGNLTAAGLLAGFGSYSQCHRVFQAVFGCTPRRFFQRGLREHMENAFEPLRR